MAAGLAGAELVVLMSSFETHPIAVMEALALGTPVLAADGSGLRELAERGLVRAVPADATTPALAAAILDQLRHPMPVPPVRLPTWDECAHAVVQVYREAVADVVRDG
jgi:glycosyltransferase involved in cell wall biosynthesis